MRALFLLLLSGCAAPEMSAAFLQAELTLIGADDPQSIDQRFADAIDKATSRVDIAVPAGEDPVIGEALLAAWERGVDVRLVTDYDQAADPGIALLLDADVPVTLADDGLSYFDFNVNNDIAFTSEDTIMTHALLVTDGELALSATTAGWDTSGEVVLMTLQGEDLVEDLLLEHNQVFGGADAVATTAFDGLAKSIADYRWRYPTQTDLDLELWFGPQERLIKRVIDAVYSARGSVHLMSNDFTDAGLAAALEAKAQYGFTVNVIVGPEFNAAEVLLSRELATQTPNVGKFRYTGADDMPTVVLIDYRDGLDGHRYTTRAFVLTHDLYNTSRNSGTVAVGDSLQGGINDQLLDGTLWEWVDYDEPSPEIHTLFDLWERHAAASEVL
jgi:phosphatidylserine/phosphatidylglycerophosphate/cardiolipin synthase-like enzyme